MKDSMKKVAFLIPTLSSGGMERVMSEVVAYFSTLPMVECHLIIYGKSSVDFYKVPTNVVIYRPEFKFNDTQRVRDTFRTIFFIRKTVRQIKPNALLSFGEYWNNLVLLSLLGLRVPIFVSDRSSPQKSLGAVHEWLRKLLYPTARGVIAQTSKAKEIFKAKFKNKNVTVISNPIRAINTRDEIKKENIIVSVGRLITSKNFNRLINIFSKLANSDWKLVIVGGDANKETNSINLQAQIDTLGMAESIILAGTQKNVEDYLLRSKIFAFTSDSEGFPNVIGEALSAGLPIVSYDCVAGPSDMIEEGKNGFLVPLFDDKMFEERLRYLMDNESIREQMGIYAVESIKKFSVEGIGKKFYDFIINKI